MGQNTDIIFNIAFVQFIHTHIYTHTYIYIESLKQRVLNLIKATMLAVGTETSALRTRRPRVLEGVENISSHL